jgi:hypothetical protein
MISLGMNASLIGKNDFFAFNKEDGEPTYTTKSFYTFGISGFTGSTII